MCIRWLFLLCGTYYALHAAQTSAPVPLFAATQPLVAGEYPLLQQAFIEQVDTLQLPFKWCDEKQQKAGTASLKAFVESAMRVDPALINSIVDEQANTLLHRVTKSALPEERLCQLIQWFAQKGADICRVNKSGNFAIDNVKTGVCEGNYLDARRHVYQLMFKDVQAKMAQGLSMKEQQRADILVTQRRDIRTVIDVMQHPGLCHLPADELQQIAQFKGYLNAQLRIHFMNLLPCDDIPNNAKISQHIACMRWLLQHGAHADSTGEPHDSRKLLDQLLFQDNYHEYSVPLAQLLLEHGAGNDSTYLSLLAQDCFGRYNITIPAQLVLLFRRFGGDIHACGKEGISACALANHYQNWLYFNAHAEDYALFCQAWDIKKTQTAKSVPPKYIKQSSFGGTSSSAHMRKKVTSTARLSGEFTRKKSSLKAIVVKARDKYSKRSKKD
jgi:hypothetical protein